MTTSAIPPDADEATLRKLHKQVLDAIKQKREPAALIPPTERRVLIGLAKRMEMQFADLVKLVESLRTNPITRPLRTRPESIFREPRNGLEVWEDRVIRPEGSINLLRIEHVTKNYEIALLSNGTFAEKADPSRWGWSPAQGEWVAMAGKQMVKPIGEEFMNAWDALPILPDVTTAKVIIAKAGLKDLPQETIVTWLIETAMQYMARIITNLIEHKPVTLRDLIIARLDHAPVSNYSAATFTPFAHALEAWCVTRNLIAEDLRTSPMFDVPVEDIWAGYASSQKLANTRAAALREAVAQALGFKKEYVSHNESDGWVKRIPSTAPSANVYGHSDDLITVYDTGKITINGKYRCVIEAVSVALPEADQVVRRMLTLATPHRNQISTLADDLPLLERAWPHIPSIWRIVEDAEQKIDRGEVPTTEPDDE